MIQGKLNFGIYDKQSQSISSIKQEKLENSDPSIRPKKLKIPTPPTLQHPTYLNSFGTNYFQLFTFLIETNDRFNSSSSFVISSSSSSSSQGLMIHSFSDLEEEMSVLFGNRSISTSLDINYHHHQSQPKPRLQRISRSIVMILSDSSYNDLFESYGRHFLSFQEIEDNESSSSSSSSSSEKMERAIEFIIQRIRKEIFFESSSTLNKLAMSSASSTPNSSISSSNDNPQEGGEMEEKEEVDECLMASMIFLEDDKGYFLNIVGSDLNLQMLSPGEYQINDFLISQTSTLSSSMLVDRWLTHETSSEIIALEQVEQLLTEMRGFPNKFHGVALTLFVNPLQNYILETETKKESSAGTNLNLSLTSTTTSSSSTPTTGTNNQKIKNPVSAFNYYAKKYRTVIAEEFNYTLNMGDINKLLGKRWKALSNVEKQPFIEMNEKDKIRYQQEIVKAGDQGRPIRALTAYNHFFHQEKQFVAAMPINSRQLSTGQHGGNRWNQMSEDERHLYNVLREAEINEQSREYTS